MRRLEVEHITPSCTYLRGYGARDLVVELKGRPPVWATRDRAWVVQPATARDVIALAERSGYEVVCTERPGGRPSSGEVVSQTSPSEKSDPGQGLW